MKMPEFIPFHFDKFTANLFKRHGAAGVGRWLLIRKAVAETETLYLNLNDPLDRETLELDTQCTPNELTELLDHAAQRGMIDLALYSSGILWIENLDQDLKSFYSSGKRKIPTRPAMSRNFSETLAHLSEKLQDVPPSHVRACITNVTNVTNELACACEADSVGQGNDGKLVEVKFVEHPVKQPEPKTESEDETMKWVAETKQVQQRVAEFVKAYGKEGKPGKVEQEFRDAAKLAAAEYSIELDFAMKGLIHKATLCYDFEVIKNETESRYRQAPENWLRDKCWLKTYGETKEKVQPVKNAAELDREDRDMQRRIEAKLEAEHEAYISGIEKALEERDRRAANK